MARRPCHSGLALILVASVMAAGLVACESEKITKYPEPDVQSEEPDVVELEDVVTGAGAAGTPCAEGSDCGSGYCLDEEALEELGLEYGVSTDHFAAPGGMCVTRGCEPGTCGGGETCTSMWPWGLLESWCLADCDELFACRWQESYTCHGLVTPGGGGMSVDAGPSDDSDAGAAATASSGVCLPEAIAAGTAAAATGGLTGGPCEADDQCIDGGFCFSDAWLDDLGEQFGLDTSPFDIPGGMCSAFCFGADDCEPGSACLPLQDTFGAPFDLCVRRCGDLDACRWE